MTLHSDIDGFVPTTVFTSCMLRSLWTCYTSHRALTQLFSLPTWSVTATQQQQHAAGKIADSTAVALQLYNPSSAVITNPVDLPILTRTWPVNLYPYMSVLPVTGSLLVIAGAEIDIYNGESNPAAFTTIDSRYPAIPNLPVPVSYPQTATFALLTLEPANDYVPEVGPLAATSLPFLVILLMQNMVRQHFSVA